MYFGYLRRSNMDPVTKDISPIMDSIQRSNDLLRMMAAARLSIDNKMMEADVVASVEGLGEKVDVSA
jgi:hypothetical protein